MSHIDDLIERHCPNGVEFKPLGAMVDKVSRIRWVDSGDEQYQYIDLTSVNTVTHAISQTSTINRHDAPDRAQQIVRRGDVLFGTTRPMLRRYCAVPPHLDGQVCSSGFCVLRPNQNLVLPNYVFHLLGTGRFYDFVEPNQRGASYPAIADSSIKEFRIPVPPLEVQREIVRVLDLFQSLEAELEAELEARRRQYAHCRDELVTRSVADPDQWVALGDLGDVFRGRRFVKDDYVADGLAAIHYGQIYTHYGTKANTVLTRVRAELKPVLRFAQTGDIVIAEVGETVEDVAKAVAWLGEEEVAVHDGCFVLRHKQNPTYLAYCMQIAAFHAEKAQFVARAKVKRLSFDGVKQLRVPLPSLDVQNRIVQVLDAFDALVNDLSSGLPAELAARRKQYEYYRNKLLTFEEAA